MISLRSKGGAVIFRSNSRGLMRALSVAIVVQLNEQEKTKYATTVIIGPCNNLPKCRRT